MDNKKCILFTICGRAGSKGVRGKNVASFCGKPIVYYSLAIYDKYVQQYGEKYIIDLAVNTDSNQLIWQIQDSGISCYFVSRKETLAGDSIAKGDVIRDTLFEVEKLNCKKYDLVVDLDITSPLRNVSDVTGVIDLVFTNKDCNFSYSVVESRRSPYFNMVCEKEDGYYERIIPTEFTSRQMVPASYDMNASIYAYAREYLLNMAYDNRHALIWKMKDTAVLDIDSEQDFELMQVLAEYYWRKGLYLDIL